MTFDEVVARIRASHFPNPGVDAHDIVEVERKIGYELPADLKQFYLEFDGASLFGRKAEVPPFRILRLNEIVRARIAVYGVDSEEYGPDSEFVFCDRGDGDYVGIDLKAQETNQWPIIDVWHEDYMERDRSEIICYGFLEFVARALESNGKSLFWL